MYQRLKFILTLDGEKIPGVIRMSDFMLIPEDENSEEYQEYLAWLAEGNEPEEWTGE